MAQQINLCTPLFLTRKRYFSAATMLQALAVFLVVAGSLSIYWAWSLEKLSKEFESRVLINQKEIDRLQAALRLSRAQAAPADAALLKDLENARDQLKQREELLAALQQGLLREGQGHAARMRLVAQSIPPQVWVTGIRADDRRLELSGYTLEPAALNVWMARLAQNPLLAGQTIATVKVERVQSDRSGSAGGRANRGGAPTWSFTLASTPSISGPGVQP